MLGHRCWRTRHVYAVQALEERVTPSFGTVGGEFRINQTTLLNQSTSPSARFVSLDGDGDVVVVWNSLDSSLTYGVYARRFGANGTPLGDEFRVNTFTTGEQDTPSVVADADGDFVVVWHSQDQDGDQLGIYGQRYTAGGIPAGGEFRVNTTTTGNQHNATVAMGAGGAFVVAWVSNQNDGAGPGIYARRYDAAGTPLSGEFLVGATTTTDDYPSAAADAAGGFVIVWNDFETIRARLYSATGTPLPGLIVVPSATNAVETSPSVGMDTDGDFVVAWYGYLTPTSTYDIFARRFNSDGTAIGNQFTVNQSTNLNEIYPSVAVDGDGDFAVTWDCNYFDAAGIAVVVRRFNAAGAPLGGDLLVNTYQSNNQRNAAADMDADGDFVVVWTDHEQDQSLSGVYAQRYADSDNNEDTAGPMVAGVFAQPSAVSIVEAGTVAGPVAGFAVTFSEPLSTAGGGGGSNSVTNPGNWRLVRNGSDISGQIVSINYSASSRPEATLTLAGTLASGQYSLTAKAAIHDLTGNGLDGDANGVGGASDFTRLFNIAGSSVLSVLVNGGVVQRSRVTTIDVALNPSLTLPTNPADAFQLKRQSDNALVTLIASTTGNAVALTFTGGTVDAQSLADGRYTLTILAAQIANFDGNGDGTTGDDFVLVGDPATPPKLYRLFGDSDGDGDVDTTDFAAFRTAFGGASNIFDFDNDGDVDTSDFGQFRQRFGVTI